SRLSGADIRLPAAISPTRLKNATATKWRVSPRFKRKKPGPNPTGLPFCAAVWKSGSKPQFSFSPCRWYRLADDALKLGCDPVQHRALLLHPLGVVVDLASDGRHGLLLLLARGMIETLRDPCIVEAKIARQGRRRPAQIVRRERLEAEQRAD